jgi:Transposase DDE domain
MQLPKEPIVPNSDLAAASEFNAAFELLRQWMNIEDADVYQPLGNATVYKTSVVMWLMLFQRINPNSSLSSAVEYFVANAPKGKNANKRLREGTLSTGSGSYSDGRKRLSVMSVDWLQNRLSSSIIESTQASFNGKRVFLIDGTTLTAFPSPALQKAFPPASNQHGEGVWPIINLVVAHELSSGAALPPEIGAMYGDNAISETKLAEPIIKRLPDASIVMADAGFGIYSVAYAAKESGHNFVFRLTAVRFLSHRKKATVVESTSTSRTYQYAWQPSAKERATNPTIQADSVIHVRLLELKIGEGWLYLITDLIAPSKAFKDLYFQRNHVEIDLRNFKVVLDTESLECQSLEMFKKELGMAMVAYNLTSQLRRQAAEKADCAPRELSFTGVWTVYKHHLQGKSFQTAAQYQAQYELALDRASRQKLPNRPGRSYPREAYARRSKSTHFQKRKKKPKTSDSADASLK